MLKERRIKQKINSTTTKGLGQENINKKKSLENIAILKALR